MNINKFFQSLYRNPADRDLPSAAPIVRVTEEIVGRKRELLPVVYLQGFAKGLILNKTNKDKIVNLTGSDETDNWIGHVIELYATTCDFPNPETPCVRVRAPQMTKQTAKKQSTPPAAEFDSAAESPDDDVPF